MDLMPTVLRFVKIPQLAAEAAEVCGLTIEIVHSRHHHISLNHDNCNVWVCFKLMQLRFAFEL